MASGNAIMSQTDDQERGISVRASQIVLDKAGWEFILDQ